MTMKVSSCAGSLAGLESLQIALLEGMREVCGITVVRSDGLRSLQIALFEVIREVCGISFSIAVRSDGLESRSGRSWTMWVTSCAGTLAGTLAAASSRMP